MRRRTKLIIIAFFLVLLAIPAAYVVLTWHVADPLRFRYVGHTETVMQPVDPFNADGTHRSTQKGFQI